MGKQISKFVPEFSTVDVASACDPEDMSKLPRLCQAILGTNTGKTTCCQVMASVRRLVNDCDILPFVYCCHGGPKVLVVPGKQDTYVAYCRSPSCDIKHLRNVAKAYGLKYKEVLELWYELPQFEASFTDNVLLKLKGRIKSDIKQKVKRIGQAYSQFDFDIAVYNALLSISSSDNYPGGFLKIDAAIANGESHVIRVLTKQVGTASSESVPPIVGLVFESNGTRKLEESLKSEPVKKLGTSLMGEWYNCKPYSFPSFGSGKWKAYTNLFANATPGSDWIARTKVAILVGLHVGIRDARKYLMDELVISGSERFLQRLAQFSDTSILPCSEEEGSIYWQQIIEDIRAVLEKVPSQDAQFMLQTRSNRIDKLLQFGDEYSLLTPAVEYESDDKQAGVRHLLRKHLLNGEPLLGGMSQYQLILESHIIRRDMSRNGGSWEEHFGRSPYATIDALFEEIEVKSVDVKSNPYGQIVIRLFEKCDEEELREVREYLVDRLYDSISSSTTKVIGEALGSFIGGMCTAATFGKVNGYSVARKLRSNRYHNDVDRFLKDISSNERKETEEAL